MFSSLGRAAAGMEAVGAPPGSKYDSTFGLAAPRTQSSPQAIPGPVVYMTHRDNNSGRRRPGPGRRWILDEGLRGGSE